MTIWKFPIQMLDGIVSVPQRIKPLHVDFQFSERSVFLWGMVDPESPVVDMEYKWYPTGMEIPRDMEYLGTLVYSESNEVWHCFWKLADQ